jgi:hypothetical protein
MRLTLRPSGGHRRQVSSEVILVGRALVSAFTEIPSLRAFAIR